MLAKMFMAKTFITRTSDTLLVEFLFVLVARVGSFLEVVFIRGLLKFLKEANMYVRRALNSVWEVVEVLLKRAP